MKEQCKTPEQLSDMEISSYLRGFRVIIMKMFQELGKRTDAQSKKLQKVFNKVRKYKEQPELKNTITEMRITLEFLRSPPGRGCLTHLGLLSHHRYNPI